MNKHDIDPDPQLSEEQDLAVGNLTELQIEEIDNLLFDSTSANFKKVAMVVGSAMEKAKSSFQGIPDLYFAQRIRQMVANGTLESQGFLANMRYSEVRRAA